MGFFCVCFLFCIPFCAIFLCILLPFITIFIYVSKKVIWNCIHSVWLFLFKYYHKLFVLNKKILQKKTNINAHFLFLLYHIFKSRILRMSNAILLTTTSNEAFNPVHLIVFSIFFSMFSIFILFNFFSSCFYNSNTFFLTIFFNIKNYKLTRITKFLYK